MNPGESHISHAVILRLPCCCVFILFLRRGRVISHQPRAFQLWYCYAGRVGLQLAVLLVALTLGLP